MQLKSLNNNTCKSIIYSCIRKEYDKTVNVFYENRTEFTDNLFVRLFEFIWQRCELKQYYKVLLRLQKNVDELRNLNKLQVLIQHYKMKGGVV